MTLHTAVVIAGGKGTRLRALDGAASPPGPKAMLPVAGKPLLGRLVEWLRANDVREVVIGVAHLSESIRDHFGDGRDYGVRIRYTEHGAEQGTADAFRTAIVDGEVDADHVFAMNSDQLTDYPLQTLATRHLAATPPPLATVLLVHPVLPFGLVEAEPDGRVRRFLEKPRLEGTANSGIYVFRRELADSLQGDLERQVFPKLAADGRLHSCRHDGFWETVNTLKDLERIEAVLSEVPR